MSNEGLQAMEDVLSKNDGAKNGFLNQKTNHEITFQKDSSFKIGFELHEQ